MSAGKYWRQNIEDVRFYVGGEEMEPIDAFNELYDGMYGVNEWYNDPDRPNFGDPSKPLEEDIGMDYYPSELRQHVQHWLNNKDSPEAQIEIDRIREGEMITEVYGIELRGHENPRDTKTPFSILSGVPVKNANSRIGVRVLRDYDQAVLERSDYIDPESSLRELMETGNGVPLDSSDFDFELQQRILSGEADADPDKIGWINEPYVQAAMDRIRGVDWQLAKEEKFDFLRPNNPEKHVYVDTDTDPEYTNSNLDVLMVYDWMEGLNQGISWPDEYAENIGRHVGTLHLLNIVNWDRSAEELYWDLSPERGGRGVVENDYEFVLWTDREDMKEADLESAKSQAVDLKQTTLGNEIPQREKERTRTQVEEAYNSVLNEARHRGVEDELSTLLTENIPQRWQKNLFEDQFLALD